MSSLVLNRQLTQRSTYSESLIATDLANSICSYFLEIKDKHFDPPVIDAAFLEKALNRFAELLDPEKLILTQEDLSWTSQRETVLISSWPLYYAQHIIDLIQRFDSNTVNLINRINLLLLEDQNFTENESLPERQAVQNYATTSDNLIDIWRRKIKHACLLERVLGRADSETRRDLSLQYKLLLDEDKSLSARKIIELALQSLTAALDPHSRVILSDARAAVSGIGIEFTQERRGFIVDAIMPGSPADVHGGITPGDLIVSVQSDEKYYRASALTIEKLTSVITGPRGTTVALGILRREDNQYKYYDYSITRDLLNYDMHHSRVRGGMISIPFDETLKESKIGYIDIPMFYSPENNAYGSANQTFSAFEDLLDQINVFISNSVDVILLDVSRNPGGCHTEVLQILRLFINSSALARTVDNTEHIAAVDYPFYSESLWHGPLVVLTSSQSASGSELLAATLKSYRRALIIGEDTFGKGTIQTRLTPDSTNPQGCNLGMNFYITTDHFLAPDNTSIQHSGVTPDLRLRTSIATRREIDRPNSLKPFRVPLRQIYNYNFVTSETVTQLKQSSTIRTQQVAQLQVLEDLAQFAMTREDTENSIPLNESEFRTWQYPKPDLSHLSPISIQTNRGSTDDPTFEGWVRSDPTRLEALRVAAEYAALLKKDKY